MNIVNFKPSENIRTSAEKLFQQERLRILETLPRADVQHIGASSIPGTITKGDLDMNVRVSRKDFKKAVELLKKLYEINQPENWSDDFASFKDDRSFDLDLGVQLVIINSNSDDFVKIRDLLSGRPDLVEKCNKMKMRFEGKSMEEYRREKAEFFENLKNYSERMIISS